MMSNPPAVILGGSITALSVARSLAAAGVAVTVLDRRDSPARVSRMVSAFIDVASDDMQDEMLQWLRSGPQGAVLLAGSDDGIELIARHRAELVALGYRPMEADDEVLLAMLDKRRTAELAHEHGVPAPRVLALRGQADIDAVSREFGYPCVLKPVHSHLFVRRTKSGAKVVTVDNPQALRSEFERMSELGVEMLAIEVIPGSDDQFVSYFSYLDERGEPLLQFTKRKLRQDPIRFGIATYHATTWDPELAELGLRFFQAVGLRGLGNVEFKRDSRDGALKLIECNARFTMANEVVRVAGIDLALFTYNRLLGRPTPPVDSYRQDVRMWDPLKDTRAFLEYRRSGALSFADWVGSLLHPQHFPVARIDDPLPAVVRAWGMIGRTWRPSARATAAWASRAGGSPWTAGLGALAERIATKGRRGPVLAARLDLVRSTGPGYPWRRLRAERRFSGLGGQVRDELYERIWREAADAVGASIEPLAPGLLEVSRDGVASRISHQMLNLDDPVALRVALDKALVHRLLARSRVSPDHIEFDVRDPAPALEFLRQTAGPCVVKPAVGGGGGYGITANVARPEELMRARLHAGMGSSRLLVERQAMGTVYRLLLLDGELLDIVRCLPGRLTGDGRSTVQALIFAENERRIKARGAAGLSLLGVSLDMLIALERAGLTLSSVPPAGHVVAIGAVTNNNTIDDNETFRGAVSPELVAAARAAQNAVGLRLAGVDVITTDPSRPLAETGGVINEVNGTPGLHHHYLVADPGGATRVAIPILERLLGRAG
jgi:predicted ATP-grasp superfamily ATP-dependent carboligase